MTKPDISALTADTIIAFIGDIFNRRGAESYLGEDVTMSEHMLQGATLAQEEEAGDILIAAALLQGIGHFTNELPEEAGARVLGEFPPPIITDCIRWHVAAKRYLCATDPGYFARLSSASVHTLALQGGPMSASEVADFAQQENLDAILRVRLWDDAGKVAGARTPAFEAFAPLRQRVVTAHTAI